MVRSTAFELTEEEATALLGLCLTSPQPLDAVAENALRKLASFCRVQCGTEGAPCEKSSSHDDVAD